MGYKECPQPFRDNIQSGHGSGQAGQIGRRQMRYDTKQCVTGEEPLLGLGLTGWQDHDRNQVAAGILQCLFIRRRDIRRRFFGFFAGFSGRLTSAFLSGIAGFKCFSGFCDDPGRLNNGADNVFGQFQRRSRCQQVINQTGCVTWEFINLGDRPGRMATQKGCRNQPFIGLNACRRLYIAVETHQIRSILSTHCPYQRCR
ncbi:MAG: hypothetical protein WBN88_14120 [Anderseniella sp.]